jgi:catechol 2,3-dioxygenase-like lactoylglutathione lyase family enzyme
MKLGQFSVSLAVKDITKSRTFYEQLGFKVIDDHSAENWLIMQNGDAVIGLFQGMFPENIMTFNPESVATIREQLVKNGMSDAPEVLDSEAYEGGKYMLLADPDGNQIMIDQVIPDYKPNKPDDV